MILTDASVLMDAAGPDHPDKASAVAFLGRVASGDVEATIDAEVLQEVLHRCRALNRWSDAQKVYDLARSLFPDVPAITGAVMDEARRILATDETLTARDAVHAAVVIIYELEGICGFDRDFDRIAGCPRVVLYSTRFRPRSGATAEARSGKNADENFRSHKLPPKKFDPNNPIGTRTLRASKRARGAVKPARPA